MSFKGFQRAKRENIGLIVSIAGGTGSGKTFSAMRLAAGIVGPGKPFAVIDTEAGRAKHYADRFVFDHGDLSAPFRPEAYADAIKAADDAGYGAIVIDSMSHEWAGEGGVLDWHDEDLDAMVESKQKFFAEKGWRFDEETQRKALGTQAWIKPKMEHKRMVQRLLQVRAHLIICLRAEEKMLIQEIDDPDRAGKKKTVFVQAKDRLLKDRWVPICDKLFPYEMTASFVMTNDDPGAPIPVKLQEQHRAIFDVAKIDEDTGRRLAAWASGADRLTDEQIAEQIAAVEPLIAGLTTPDAVRTWWAGHQKTLDEAVKPAILKLCTERANALKAAANTETNNDNSNNEKEAA